MAEIHDRRAQFNASEAPTLAAKAGFDDLRPLGGRLSSRFAHFLVGDRVVIVAGDQEKTDVDLALAYGLGQVTDGQRLTLLLPRGRELPTVQRSAWLAEHAKPDLWVHDDGAVEPLPGRSQSDTIEAIVARLDDRSPERELREATRPLHLGATGEAVDELVEWATQHPGLDHAHRRDERSWHHAGQRVLSIRSTREGLSIRAGIHSTSVGGDVTVDVPATGSLSTEDRTLIFERVEAGINARAQGKYHKPDEHWLQAVIRRTPSIVGVEQPALRELPAWRPIADPERPWGRGYLDLVGVDGHGDIRLVETKLAKNDDPLLVLQGLDYLVWTTAYREPITQRLGAHSKARLVIHYVIGATPDDRVHIASAARTHAHLLAPEVQRRFQVVYGWWIDPGASGPRAELHQPRVLPKDAP